MKKVKKAYNEGDKRYNSGFLYIPKRIVNSDTMEVETRWLEKAIWEEELCAILTLTGVRGEWFPTRWVDNPLEIFGRIYEE